MPPRTETDSAHARRVLLARTFAWSFTGDAISKVAILVTSLIAVRALAPVEFGLYLALSATAILAAAFWDAGVSTVVTREVAAKHLAIRQAIRQCVILRVRTFPIWVASFAIGCVILARDADVTHATFAAFAAASLVIATHTLTLSILRAELRFRAAAGSLSVGRWVTAVLSLTALQAADMSEALLMLALALLIGEAATLAASVVAIVHDSRSADVSLEGARSETRVTFRAALPFAVNSVLNLAFNRFDIVILAALSSAEQLSLYAPASRIQDALYLIPVAVGTIALPLVARELQTPGGAAARRAIVGQLLMLGLVLSLPVALLVFVYAPEVIDVVLGDEYAGAVTSTRILIWSLPFSALTTVLLAALAGSNRALDTTRVLVVAFTVAMVMHLSLDWWLGATGAAIASLSREPAALVTALICAQRAGLVALRRPGSTPRGASSEASPIEP